MNDKRLKLLLTVLSGIIFGMLFILLALIVPIHEKKNITFEEKPKSRLEHISKSMRDR